MTERGEAAAVEAARRQGDAAAAGHSGAEAAARLMLSDPEPDVRAAAFGALARMGCATPADSAAAVADPDPRVRRYACELGPGLLGADFTSLLGDPDDAVVEAACYAVGEVRDTAAVPALARIARTHTDVLCRESAVAAIGAMGDPEGLPAVLAALDDTLPVRRRAVIALACFQSAAADAAIKACLDDPDWLVRQAAEDLLGVNGGGD
ncbi:MAG: HEAT repeat domain-containing protein [Acidimicrobiales bacterium]|jgi:HEAT repeat protein